MFSQLKSDTADIISRIIRNVYFMRGAISYHEMMLMSPGERDLIETFLKERLEMESKRAYPQY